MSARALAGALARVGFSTLRLDLAGCGQADGRFVDFTITRASEDVLAAQDFGRRLPGVSRISAIGISSGGLITLAALAQAAAFSRICLLAPVADYAEKRRRELGAAGIDEWASSGVTRWTDPDGRSHDVGYEFFIDAQRWVVDRLLCLPDLPVLVVHGDRDSNTPLWHGKTITQRFPRAQLQVVSGADHLFRVCGGRYPIEVDVASWFATTVGD